MSLEFFGGMESYRLKNAGSSCYVQVISYLKKWILDGFNPSVRIDMANFSEHHGC
jgi:hypothetical protein